VSATGRPAPDLKFFNMCGMQIAGRAVRALRHGGSGRGRQRAWPEAGRRALPWLTVNHYEARASQLRAPHQGEGAVHSNPPTDMRSGVVAHTHFLCDNALLLSDAAAIFAGSVQRRGRIMPTKGIRSGQLTIWPT
jgi:hypothetical protein